MRRLSPRLWLDLAQTLVICLRVFLAPRGRAVALGFFVHGQDSRLLPRAVCPDATFIRVGYPRRRRGWDSAAFAWLLRTLTRIAGSRKTTAIVWSYRDRTDHNEDVGRYFADCWRAERALIRTPSLGNTAYVVGNRSIYFDGRASTECEQRLNALEPGSLPNSEAGRRILAHVLASGLSKYQASTTNPVPLSNRDLLILGQCTGDQAITQTEALAQTNAGLVQLATERLQGFDAVYFKPHPKNRTNATDLARISEHFPQVRIIDANTNVVPLLAARPVVATLSSGAGLEAAIRGCKVNTFGVPFYSHWGFTIDHLPCPRRTNRLSAEDVFLFMLMEHTKYVDPDEGRRISAVEAFGLA
jgi:capsular polysaccharide export protein